VRGALRGGEGIQIRTDATFYKRLLAKFDVINWHLIGDTDPQYPSAIPTDGKMYPVKAGDLIGYADNMGAPFESSGDHLHFGLQPLDQYNTVIEERNGYGGCIDPTSYFDGTYAQDTPRDASYIAGLLAQAWALFRAKFGLQ
jgi:hypothetical protein